MEPASVRLQNVCISYERYIAVHGVTGRFAQGSATAIDLGGLRRENFGYLPQAVQMDRQFPVTVAETVMSTANLMRAKMLSENISTTFPAVRS